MVSAGTGTGDPNHCPPSGLVVHSGFTLISPAARRWHNGGEMNGSNPTSPAQAPPQWQIPRLDPANGVVSGLSAGLARELFIEVRWVRMAWVALFIAGGFGGALYLAAWATLAWLDYRGLSADYRPQPKGRNRTQRQLGFGVLVLGLFGVFASIGGLPPRLIWPLGVIALGVLIVWSRVGPNVTDRSEGPYPLIQTIGGVVLAAAGAVLMVQTLVGAEGAAAVLFAVIGILLVAVVGSSPWWWRILQDLDSERQARVRSDERASVAAHIHDSVLQTLTLIQKSDDPKAMVALARQQERDLRNWLDPDRASRSGQSIRGRLDELIGQVEAHYPIEIETVVVGDTPMDPALEELCSAAREATVNAAKHAKTTTVDLYLEVADDRVDVFVRDRGVGFDPSLVAGDRQGIANSIRARMSRIGGTATISSEPGEGTEVELVLPRTPPINTDPSPDNEDVDQ